MTFFFNLLFLLKNKIMSLMLILLSKSKVPREQAVLCKGAYQE